MWDIMSFESFGFIGDIMSFESFGFIGDVRGLGPFDPPGAP